MEMGGLTAEQVDHIIQQAEAKAEEAEQAAADERRRQRAQERLDAATAAANAAEGAEPPAEPATGLPAEENVAGETPEGVADESMTSSGPPAEG